MCEAHFSEMRWYSELSTTAFCEALDLVRSSVDATFVKGTFDLWFSTLALSCNYFQFNNLNDPYYLCANLKPHVSRFDNSCAEPYVIFKLVT